MTAMQIVIVYLALLLLLSVISKKMFKGTIADYFTATHSIGPFMLLMSVFGTTMTAFALVGSTSEAYHNGTGVYGLLASLSGFVHAAVFYLIGIRVFKWGKKFGFTTQIDLFRARYDNNFIGYLLFPTLVCFIIPYLLIGLLASGTFFQQVSNKSISTELGSAIIAIVVLIYIFIGGVRGAAIANTFQTCVFMILGFVAFILISNKLGGVESAMKMVVASHPEKLVREGNQTHLIFLSYFFIPLSVAMFPHLFQHWLTAKSAKAFKLTVFAHPIFIMLVWIPCVLIGIWATSAMVGGELVVPKNSPPNTELAIMVKKLTSDSMSGLLMAGVLAAIMSSLDSQFFCLGTMFTNDILFKFIDKEKISDKAKIWYARGFIITIVVLTWLISLVVNKTRIFPLAVWSFSGFAGLSPLIFAAIYWKRSTGLGIILGVVGALFSWLYFFWDSGFGVATKYNVLGLMPVTFIVLSCVIGLVIGNIFGKRVSEEILNKFFKKEN